MAWRPMQGGEGGSTNYWYDPDTGEVSFTDPNAGSTFGGLVQYGDPQQVQGSGEYSGITQSLPNIASIGGYTQSDYQTRPIGGGKYATYNPAAKQWEYAFRVPESIAGNTTTFVPQSIAAQIPGSSSVVDMANKGSLFEQALPMLIASGLTGGLASTLGAGFGLGGITSNALAGGITSGFMGGNPINGAIMSALGSAAKGAVSSAKTTITASGYGTGMTDVPVQDIPYSPTGDTTPGANMGFFDDYVLNDGWANVGDSGGDTSYLTNNFGDGSLGDQFPDTTINTANIGDFIKSAIQNGNLDQVQKLLGLAGTAKSLFGGSSGGTSASLGGAGKSLGGSILDGIFGDGTSSTGMGGLGTAAFNSLPFVLALQQANSQSGDVQPYIDKLNSLGDQFAGNQSAFIKSLTDPYDQSTATGRGQLQQSLGLRGVSGSSFGDQALNTYDFTRDTGRADLVGKATTTGVGAEGQLLGTALDAINKRNLNKNALLGAGLSASGRLFQPANDPFNIKALLGA